MIYDFEPGNHWEEPVERPATCHDLALVSKATRRLVCNLEKTTGQRFHVQ